ncbi:MAG: hypothetical protein ASARMPRED_009361 [Alectoria sarmentosa]|nr:MAG: hypothetical protein ASARMPRED_009361 [Alectoria sarmentosa]
MYNRDRRISDILSGIDDLSDIDTCAADEFRAVHHEHSITAFLEGHSPTTDHLHDCNSPLERETTEERRAIGIMTPSAAIATSHNHTMVQKTLPPKVPILSAPLNRHHQRRGTVENGATSWRSRDLDSPPPSPISESFHGDSRWFSTLFDLTTMANYLLQVPVFFGNCPEFKSPPLLKAAGSADSVDALEEAAVAARPNE